MQRVFVWRKGRHGNVPVWYRCLNGGPPSNLNGAGNNWVGRNASRCDIHCSGGYSLLRRCCHLKSPPRQPFRTMRTLNLLPSHGIRRSCGNSLRGFRQRHNLDPAYRILSYPLGPSWSISIESCLLFLARGGDWGRGMPLQRYQSATEH